MVNQLKTKEIRQMSDDQLVKKESELKNELFNLRFQLATGQLDNPQKIKVIKRDIARVKTIITERAMKIGKEA